MAATQYITRIKDSTNKREVQILESGNGFIKSHNLVIKRSDNRGSTVYKEV